MRRSKRIKRCRLCNASLRRRSVSRLLAATAPLATLFFAGDTRAETVAVATAEELLTAIAEAAPGDEIVLAAGVYALSGASCAAEGTEVSPIVVRAAAPQMAVIELDGLEGFRVSGAHWHFEDLEIRGVCATDPECEHAFHVTGGAVGFWLRNSRVLDFNAQLKVNAEPNPDGGYLIPHGGLVEGNELRDTSPRETDSPVTKLNIDTGDDWVVRGNVIADFHKNGGNGVSYGAFMKSGGRRGLFERNLVLCSELVDTGGTRIGLSFGGGGTGAAYCAPAFDPNVPCDPEHTDGVLRNNVIVNCSDVGVYLNLAADTQVLFNTLIGTAGIDFRFASTSGVADGNLLSGVIRARDGAAFTAGTNAENVTVETFTAVYAAPLSGDLRVAGDVSAWTSAGAARPDVPEDYCLRDRPGVTATLGALEHSLGDCLTVPPPGSMGASGAGPGGAGGSSSGGAANAGDGGSGDAGSSGNVGEAGADSAGGAPSATSGAAGDTSGAGGTTTGGAPINAGADGEGVGSSDPSSSGASVGGCVYAVDSAIHTSRALTWWLCALGFVAARRLRRRARPSG